MCLTILKYIGIPVIIIVAIGGAWLMGSAHGVNKQRDADAQAQLILQKRYDAILLLKTTFNNDVMESYTNAAVATAINTTKHLEKIDHDKQSINSNTRISNQFVRDASYTSMPSASSNPSAPATEASALYESIGISNPWRVSKFIMLQSSELENCGNQLNALIDVVQNNNK